MADKSFALASSMKKHMLVHSEEKPHTCKICDKSFSQATNLKRHMVVHNGD
jgi:uncharacterized Zn-finger protein